MSPLKSCPTCDNAIQLIPTLYSLDLQLILFTVQVHSFLLHTLRELNYFSNALSGLHTAGGISGFPQSQSPCREDHVAARGRPSLIAGVLLSCVGRACFLSSPEYSVSFWGLLRVS